MNYSYDEAGNKTSLSTLMGPVSYAYDASNRLSSLTLPTGGVINYSYNDAGNLVRADYPNGTYVVYEHDQRNRLVSLQNVGPAGTISNYAYSLDGVGNRIAVSAEEPLGRTFSSEIVYSTYSVGNQLISANETRYEYDANGNLVRRAQDGSETTYIFNSQDKLTGVLSPSTTSQYQYNGLGDRVAKTINGTTIRFLVDRNGPLSNIVAEVDEAGNILSHYLHDGVALVAKMLPAGDTYFYHYDALGNTVAMTDASGNVVNKYVYDAFGGLLDAEETVPNPFLYVGQYGVMADESGLLYLRARYYDPVVGRFISKDPIRLEGGDINLYGCVGNNPTNKIDPHGLLDGVSIPWPWPIIWPWQIPWSTALPNPIVVACAIVLWPSEIAEEDEWVETRNRLIEKCHKECEHLLDQPGIEGRCNQGVPYRECMKECMGRYDFAYPGPTSPVKK